jgi:sulfate adenylyltransferase subunit 1 (EFTu-like GTPase family)
LHKRYRIKHAARQEWAEIKEIPYRININTLEHEPAISMQMNEIALVHVETARALTFDAYRENRVTGSFILVDPVTNATVAAGMISGAVERKDSKRAKGISWRIQGGELTVSLPSAMDAAAGTIEDPETREALERLLRRLK